MSMSVVRKNNILRIDGKVLDAAVTRAYLESAFGALGTPHHVLVDADGTISVRVREKDEPHGPDGFPLHVCCIHPLGVLRKDKEGMQRANYEALIAGKPEVFLAPVRAELIEEAASRGIELVIE